jgi:hypothetical protein
MPGLVVANDSALNVDFRVEGQSSYAYLLFVDASAATVGIGGSSQDSVALFGQTAIALKKATTLASATIVTGLHNITARSGSASQSAAEISDITWDPTTGATGNYTLTLTGCVEGQLFFIVNIDTCYNLIVQTSAGVDTYSFGPECAIGQNGILQFRNGYLRVMGAV